MNRFGRAFLFQAWLYLALPDRSSAIGILPFSLALVFGCMWVLRGSPDEERKP